MPESQPFSQTTTYASQVIHVRREGIVSSAIAGKEPQYASLVRLHAPFEMWQVFWTAVRQGCPPILPSSKSYLQNYNRVFMGGERHGLVYPANVGHYWLVAGRYDYAISAPEGLDNDFHLAKMPWETDTNRNYFVPFQHFQTGILDDSLVNYTGLGIDPDVPELNTIPNFALQPQPLNAAIP